MRVLFCNFEYPPLGGGGGVINALLAEELATRHEVTVLTSRASGLPARSVENGVRIVRVPVLHRRHEASANLASMFGYMVAGTFGGRKLLQTERFDVINTHFVLPSGPVGDALARMSGLPNVLSLHGGDLFDPSKWTSPHRHALLRFWVRRLLRRADHVVGQSANTVANVHDFYDRSLPVAQIPLGIRRPPAAAGARHRYGFGDDDLLIVTVGRLIARKAIDQLIAMMPDLPERARLLIMGDGPKETELRRQAAALGLGDRVRFLGHVGEAEKFRILHMADVFVSTSQHEGFGLVFLEAMACGLPVVCYDHGGQVDFLETGVTGEVVRLNERGAFASALLALLNDRSARERMAAASRERVEAYLIDHCGRRYETIFEQAIRGRQPEPAVLVTASHSEAGRPPSATGKR